METALTIFKAFAFISVIFSILFVSARVYAGYIRKEDGCSDGCPCQANRVDDQITDSVTVEKPAPKKRGRKPVMKRVSAIDKEGKLVWSKVSDLPQDKKPARMKKPGTRGKK